MLQHAPSLWICYFFWLYPVHAYQGAIGTAHIVTTFHWDNVKSVDDPSAIGTAHIVAQDFSPVWCKKYVDDPSALGTAHIVAPDFSPGVKVRL